MQLKAEVAGVLVSASKVGVFPGQSTPQVYGERLQNIATSLNVTAGRVSYSADKTASSRQSHLGISQPTLKALGIKLRNNPTSKERILSKPRKGISSKKVPRVQIKVRK